MFNGSGLENDCILLYQIELYFIALCGIILHDRPINVKKLTSQAHILEVLFLLRGGGRHLHVLSKHAYVFPTSQLSFLLRRCLVNDRTAREPDNGSAVPNSFRMSWFAPILCTVGFSHRSDSGDQRELLILVWADVMS